MSEIKRLIQKTTKIISSAGLAVTPPLTAAEIYNQFLNQPPAIVEKIAGCEVWNKGEVPKGAVFDQDLSDGLASVCLGDNQWETFPILYTEDGTGSYVLPAEAAEKLYGDSTSNSNTETKQLDSIPIEGILGGIACLGLPILFLLKARSRVREKSFDNTVDESPQSPVKRGASSKQDESRLRWSANSLADELQKKIPRLKIDGGEIDKNTGEVIAIRTSVEMGDKEALEMAKQISRTIVKRVIVGEDKKTGDIIFRF